jgi:hypothetical protein
MDRILRLKSDKKAADVCLSADAAARFKINAQAPPIKRCQAGHRIVRAYPVRVRSSVSRKKDPLQADTPTDSVRRLKNDFRAVPQATAKLTKIQEHKPASAEITRDLKA